MRPRPRVDLVVPLPPVQVLERLRAALAEPDACCEGHVGTRELSLRVRGGARHLFSPWVSLEVRPDPEGSSVTGHVGPAPQLWTLFVFVYALQVAVWVAGLMYGLVQWNLGWTPTGLLATGGATVSLGLSCGVDLVGRRVGAPQIAVLWDFLRDSLGEIGARQREEAVEAELAAAG